MLPKEGRPWEASNGCESTGTAQHLEDWREKAKDLQLDIWRVVNALEDQMSLSHIFTSSQGGNCVCFQGFPQ